MLPTGERVALSAPLAAPLLVLVAGMDDEHVAARATGDVLADASAEQPLEKAWLPGADNDQLGGMLLGCVDQLLRRLARDARELDPQVRIREQDSHPFAMLRPQL